MASAHPTTTPAQLETITCTVVPGPGLDRNAVRVEMYTHDRIDGTGERVDPDRLAAIAVKYVVQAVYSGRAGVFRHNQFCVIADDNGRYWERYLTPDLSVSTRQVIEAAEAAESEANE